jgi:hypothetical protein
VKTFQICKNTTAFTLVLTRKEEQSFSTARGGKAFSHTEIKNFGEAVPTPKTETAFSSQTRSFSFSSVVNSTPNCSKEVGEVGGTGPQRFPNFHPFTPVKQTLQLSPLAPVSP